MKERRLKCCSAVSMLLLFGAAINLFAESFTTNVIDGLSTNGAGTYVVGETGPFNFLLITNGGTLTNSLGIIGRDAGANSNLAIVTGIGSAWRSGSSPGFVVGSLGSANRLIVRDGGQIGDGIAVLGSNAISTGNSLEILGADTRCSVSVRVGFNGSANELVVAQGAQVTAGFIRVAAGLDSKSNRVTFADSGTIVSSGGQFTLGGEGPSNYGQVRAGARLSLPANTVMIGQSNTSCCNVLDVSGVGTALDARYFRVGGNGASNAVTISDYASLSAAFEVDIGSDSAGNILSLLGGATARTGWIRVGRTSNAPNNALLIDGVGTVWTNTGHTVVGLLSSGNYFALTGGAIMRGTPLSGDFWVGANTTSNVAYITGSGTFLAHRNIVLGGSTGCAFNELYVSRGAVLESEGGQIGSRAANTNTADLAGIGTEWRTKLMAVGGHSNIGNRLLVRDGAALFAGGIHVGYTNGQGNIVILDGVGSSILSTGLVLLGGKVGGNEIYIQGGAHMRSGSCDIGPSFESITNKVTISGHGSGWSNGVLRVGLGGSQNSILISDGGRMESDSVVLGLEQGSRGNALHLVGQSAECVVRSNVYLGALGYSNVVRVASGAHISCGDMTSARSVGGFNSVVVDGAASRITAQNSLIVGTRWDRLDIRNGGVVSDERGVLSGFFTSATVRDFGSQWINTNLFVGSNGLGASLSISRGARVYAQTGYVGLYGIWTNNYMVSDALVQVTDPESCWQTDGPLLLGAGAFGNVLAISNAATVAARNLSIGVNVTFHNELPCISGVKANTIFVAGGQLIVTNGGNGFLNVNCGRVHLASGLVQVDVLGMTNPLSQLVINGGTLRCREALIANGAPLEIGDGVRAARLEQQNGALVLTNGLLIRRHSVLSGAGAINGGITNAGTVRARRNMTGSALMISGSLHQLAGSTLFIEIADSQSEPAVVQILGNALLDGSLGVALRDGFVPSAINAFKVLECANLTGRFANADDGERLITSDQLGSFRVVYTNNTVILDDYRSTDTDGDGIADDWAMAHFGRSPLSELEKNQDLDLDGASNYEEFVAGTRPNNAADVFALSATMSGTIFVIGFPVVDGKRYRFWFSDDLRNWREVQWPPLEHLTEDYCQWMDDGFETGGLGNVSRFYSVTVE